MWIDFLISFCLTALILIAPGLIALFSLGCTGTTAVALAAPVSTALILTAGIISSFISNGMVTLVFILLCFELLIKAIGVLLRRNQFWGSEDGSCAIPWSLLMIYMGIAIVLLSLLFLKNIEGADSFIRFDDNHSHLSWIKTMAESGNYSTLRVSYYSSQDPSAPFRGSSYYPAGFDIIAAISLTFYPTVTSVAENAAICVFLVGAYAPGVCLLLTRVLAGRSRAVIFGSVTMMASTAYPLRMLTVHGPFPNIAGFSCVPAALGVFILILPCIRKKSIDLRYVTPFFLVTLGLLFLHPNALIFAILGMFSYWLVSVVPFFARFICRKSKKGAIANKLTFTICFFEVLSLLIAILCWVVLHESSIMQSIVSFIWDWSGSFNSIAGSIANGGLLLGIPQVAFGVLLIIGLISIINDKKSSWFVLFFFITSTIYVVTGISSSNVKSWVSGFWYTDPERLAAMVAIAATPLVAVGLEKIWTIIESKADSMNLSLRVPMLNITGHVLLASIFFGLNYFPYYLYPGSPNDTSFGQTFYELNSAYSDYSPGPYTVDEREFVAAVKEVVGENKVINFPGDGSSFAYSVDNFNVYYHGMSGSDESESSKLIRFSLADISQNEDVRNAVDSIGARYVMLLDRSEFVQNEDGLSTSINLSFQSDQWRGLLKVCDDTPGFIPILKSGNMRLYEIVM